MTVRQLMILLSAFEPDLIVTRADNSGGFEDIHDVDSEVVVEGINHNPSEDEGPKKTVVVLS